MQRQKIVIVIGVVLALSGVILINTYVQQREQEIKSQAKKAITKIQTNQTAVLTAKKDIPRGAIVEPDMFDSSIIPNQYLTPQAVTSLDRIAGMSTNADISKGEQISLTKLFRPKEADKDSLSAATPAGKRAITISVDNVASLAGMVRPGDYVDVITTLPIPITAPDGKQASQMAVLPLFQNVLVLAVGQNLGRPGVVSAEGRYDKDKEEKKEASSPYVTLALNPEEANLIAFVQEQGKLRLTLRSPIDSNIGPVQPASWETVFQYIMPKGGAVKEAPKSEETVSGETIEIYRGLKKERIPLSKG